MEKKQYIKKRKAVGFAPAAHEVRTSNGFDMQKKP